MKTYKLIIIIIFVLIRSNNVNSNKEIININEYYPKPIYSDIWGTIYHAEAEQCDDTPTITGDGSKIDIYNASKLRWLAISQEMLNCEYRTKLHNNNSSPLYKGKIKYGDTVWVESPHKSINGLWIVHDTKNMRYRKSIDFLQTKNDDSLYNGDKLWSGRFDNIKIYKYCDVKILKLN